MTDVDAPTILHLLRHAHAGDSFAWDGADEVRPLTKRGRRQAERLGSFLARHDIRPDAIVSSPKVRAAQTAELVGAALDVPVAFDQRLADGFDLAELELLVDELGVAQPMLVGHDPDLSTVLQQLCAARGLTMRKGSLASVETTRPLRPGSGVLRWLVPPDVLADG